MEVVPVQAKAKVESANAFFIIPALSGKNAIMGTLLNPPAT